MKLYHGTNNKNIEYFDINKSNKCNDFGKGIYFTTNFVQAFKWATQNGEGAIYEIDIDFDNIKCNVVRYKKNDEDFLDLCYLCLNDTEDVANELIDNFENADIICGPMLRNFDDVIEYEKILHGDDNYIKLDAYDKVGEINTGEKLNNMMKFWKNYDQICFKESTIELLHKSLTKIYYVKGSINEKTLKYDEKSKKIKIN